MTRLRTLQLLPCSPQIGSAEVTGTITLDADSFYSFACEFSADQMVFVWVRDVSILPPVTAADPPRTGQCCDLECCILPFDAPSLSSSPPFFFFSSCGHVHGLAAPDLSHSANPVRQLPFEHRWLSREPSPWDQGRDPAGRDPRLQPAGQLLDQRLGAVGPSKGPAAGEVRPQDRRYSDGSVRSRALGPRGPAPGAAGWPEEGLVHLVLYGSSNRAPRAP